MIRNYLKIALRSLWRDRTFSFINLLGLAVGLASVLMILAYVRFELSYDKHYSNAPNVYRLVMVSKVNGKDQERLDLPEGLGEVYQKEFPAITAFSRVRESGMRYKYKGQIVNIKGLAGSRDFFKLFNFTFVSGSANQSLVEPNSVVITQSTAAKYFPGVADVVGKTMYDVDEAHDLRVTGVIKDIPANTHFTADVILSGSGRKVEPLNWQAYSSVPQYVLLNENASATAVQAQLKSIYKKYNFPQDVVIKLQAVTSIHLYSHTESEFMPNGDVKYIYIFASIAMLILLIACINYINLTTARSIQRAREIGVRKVLGAVKNQLVIQFLSESFLFFVVCAVLGILLANVAWPLMAGIIGSTGQGISLFDSWSMLLMAAIVLVFGFISGIYPAFILSKVKTAQVIKGTVKLGVNVSLRKVLVAVQFVISGVLMVSTLIIYQQLNYVNKARLGFDKDHLIVAPFFQYNSHVGAFKNELKQNPNVKAVTVASWETGVHFGGWATMTSQKDTAKTWKFQFVDADPDFIETMGINVVHGRNFSKNNPSDVMNFQEESKKLPKDDRQAYQRLATSRAILVNHETLAMIDTTYKDNMAIYKGALQGTVIGEVENFNGLNLHEKIPAVVIRCNPDAEFGQMYIRINPARAQQTIAYIQNKWNKFYPDNRFDFTFVDDKLQALYSSDKRVGQLFGTFSILAIIIACLGLFGLISLTVQQRVKEIGIRKVLGASVANITTLLSADFLKLVIISMLIASPIAWYMMSKWLQDFAYHINISWWIFALATVISLLIAFFTVSFRSIKAASANPVSSLRSE